MVTSFKINQFLELRLEDELTNIYVDGIFFRHCKYLLLNIPVEDTQVDSIESIDEAAEYLNKSLEPIEGYDHEVYITGKQVHAGNHISA